ncbi:MAG: methylated-DNA--[protein]-cysteine S-methyltransferase [Alphaproteobacteria bacterium]
MTLRRSFPTPVGRMTVVEAGGVIVRIGWRIAEGADSSRLLDAAEAQFGEYFARARRTFDLPVAPDGSPFEQAVWREMCAIPFGETRSYADLARATGGVARAVGQACGANPIPIVIPCHRVTGSHGLGGFSGGEGRMTKRRLLGLEGAMLDL